MHLPPSGRPLRLLAALAALGLFAGDDPRATFGGDDAKPAAPAAPLVREFAGRYAHGDGLATNRTIVLKEDGSISYRCSGCLGEYDRLERTVRLEGGVLILSGRIPPGGTRPTALVPIRWGNRHYLVDKSEMEAFCAAVNSGEEPRERLQGSFFLRVGDQKERPAVPPGVPKPWRDLLRVKPPEEVALLGPGA